MGGGPIIIIDPKRFDFTSVMARASTWLAVIAASSAGGLVFYATMPERVQNLMPDWTLLALGGIGMICGIATPFATSFKQKNLGRYVADQSKTE